MRTSILNRGQIITQGLEEGGNPGITGIAATFLNLFLDELYASYDWPWLRKEATISISNGGNTIDISGFSSNARQIQEIRLDNSSVPLTEWPGTFAELRIKLLTAAEGGSTGEPRWFMVDPDRSQQRIYVYPIADKAYTGYAWYQYQPAALTSDNEIPTCPSAAVMVAAVAEFAARYDRDDMFAIVTQAVRMAKARLRRDRVWGGGRQETIPFDKTVHNWKRNK